MYIDHNSLRHLHKQDKVSSRHARWVAYLERFTYVVKHKSGVANHVVDALSRIHYLLVNMRVEVPGFETFHDLLDTDPYFSVVLQDVQAGKKTEFLFHEGFLFRGNQLCIPSCSRPKQLNSTQKRRSSQQSCEF